MSAIASARVRVLTIPSGESIAAQFPVSTHTEGESLNVCL